MSRPDFRPAQAAVQGAARATFDPVFDITPDDSGTTLAAPRIALTSDSAVVGTASFYEGAQETSSGEQYDPDAFTAAAQLEIRDRFGGIRYGKNYQPCYAIGEFGGRKIIVKFNDVGPLMPGRKFDLSRAAMAYFDQTLQVGLLPEFRMTPLPLGQVYQTGPVSDEQLATMGIAYGDEPVVTAAVSTETSADEAEAPAQTPPAATGMERDDALQERRAFANPEEPAGATTFHGMDDVQGAVFAFDAGRAGNDGRLLRLGDLIDAGRRLVALVGGGIPDGRREEIAAMARRDARIENGAAFHGAVPAFLPL
jgi:rare lipoprotein A